MHPRRKGAFISVYTLFVFTTLQRLILRVLCKLCFDAQASVFVQAERECDRCIIRMGFGFHRDSEHCIALLFDERGEADIFTTDGEHHVVCKVKTGEVRLGYLCTRLGNEH